MFMDDHDVAIPSLHSTNKSVTSTSSLFLDSPSLRKRKRSDSDEVQGELISELSPMDDLPGPSKDSAYRDKTYYFEDGSCVLLVGDCLFNVHRSLLSRDNSLFSSMFTLPQGSRVAEGNSDDDPVVLRGDKPSEFRNFLWALYALPPELQIVNSAGADLTQLIDIARISNKYSFKSLETWALDAVQEYVNRRPSSSSPHHSSSSSFFGSGMESLNTNPIQPHPHLALIENTDQLTRLIELAQLCSHERLLNSMIALLRQLMNRSLHYAYLSMALADNLNLRTLRGAAYLEVMQRGTFTGLGSPKRESEDHETEGSIQITPAQQVRLLTGYWHLTRTWERLRSNPPSFIHAPSCSATWHQPGCTQAWVEFWKEKTRGEAVMSLGLADVIGRLKQVQKDYDRSGPTYMAHDCKLAARRSLMECIKTVEERLPDYFSGEGLEEDC